MADQKTTQLTENTTPVTTDILPMVDDPGGTPASQKVTVDNLLSVNDARTKTLTNTTIDADGTGNSLANVSAAKIQGVEVDATQLASPSDGDIMVYRTSGSDFVLEPKPAAGSNPAAADITDATADGIALITSADANPFTDADETKLDGIEASADVTDATNVAAAGAHMSGGTDVPVADGGTGASTASGARTNLGVDAAGTDNAPAASTTVAGKIEIATQAETDTGTDTTRAVTPSTLANYSGLGGGSSPLTTKGDVYTYDTGDQRLAVGTNGQVLTADSAEATGLKWATPSGGGGGSPVVDKLTPSTVITNTTSETTIYSYTLLGGAMGADGIAHMNIHGRMFNGSGSTTTLTVKVKLGGVTIYEDRINNIASWTEGRGTVIDLYITNVADEAINTLSGDIRMDTGGTTTTGEGELGSDEITSNAMIHSTTNSTVDTSSNQTLEVTGTFSVASTNCRFEVKRGFVEIF